MKYDVVLTDDASNDLRELITFIRERDGDLRAEGVLTKFESTIEQLGRFPSGGTIPRELSALGVTEYRQLHFKPYRVMFRVFEQDKLVTIYLIVDGRRDLGVLLGRRLLGPR